MVTKLSSLDFMMMDVHRPLLNEEIEAINPEALVDKSLRVVQNDDSEAPGVGTPHEEKYSARCEFCFGPMPCPKHPNVEPLDIITSLDLNATQVLAAAHGAGLKEVVVVGMKHDGTEYFASNISDAAPSMYHLQRGIYKLNKVVDGEYEDNDAGPKDRA